MFLTACAAFTSAPAARDAREIESFDDAATESRRIETRFEV